MYKAFKCRGVSRKSNFQMRYPTRKLAPICNETALRYVDLRLVKVSEYENY